jgi:ribose/xylose/arabinose/galactoside ABC-type transport system permease subunit
VKSDSPTRAGLFARGLRHLPWLFTAAILVPIALSVPAFQHLSYWLELPHQYFAPAMLALALTPIILTGGIDLSVGSTTVLVSVVIGALWRDLGWPIAWAIMGGVVVGLLCGLANSAFIVLGVLPLVATLATRELYRGLAFSLSGNNPVNRFPSALGTLWREEWFGQPLPLYGIAGLFVITYFAVHHTWVGRMTYALGDNEEAARYAGVAARGIKVLLYGWSGLVAGLCGAGLVMKYGAAKADAERTLELAAITYVVVGGVRITGGGGSVTGTLLGIVTVSVLLAWLDSALPTWRATRRPPAG